MENFLQWIEKILGFLKSYGFLNILKSCVVIIIFELTIAIAFNPRETLSTIIEMVHSIENEKHASNEEVRHRITPIINELLDNSIKDLNCDRAFIMEGHNGKSNVSGLGFYYVDMTYERCKRTTLGSNIEKMSEIDYKLDQMININKTNFIVAVEIPEENSANRFMGILGYSFEETPTYTQEQIKNYMLEVRRRVKILLSLTSLEGVDLEQYRSKICLN